MVATVVLVVVAVVVEVVDVASDVAVSVFLVLADVLVDNGYLGVASSGVAVPSISICFGSLEF